MEGPARDIHRFLISTTSRFTGIYDSPDIRIDHAWAMGSPYRVRQGTEESPHSRNYFVVSVRIDEPAKQTIVVPKYGPVGDRLCAALAILYGKVFYNHGLWTSGGDFYVPEDGYALPASFFNTPPYSHQVRKDLEIPLNLDRFSLVAPLFTGDTLEERVIHLLFAAARFYLRSLQIFEYEPEFAYLDLVTCGEILASYPDFRWEEVVDETTRVYLERIRCEVQDGEKIVRHFRQRMLQIKRRYTLTLMGLLTDEFFAGSECTDESLQLAKPDIENRIKASYDLRSRYLHTGATFGQWVQLVSRVFNEVPYGKPVLPDSDLSKTLSQAPTYIGLERIIRYSLLRFIHLRGCRIDTSLDDTAGETA